MEGGYFDRRLRLGEFFGDESAALAERAKRREVWAMKALWRSEVRGLDLVREHVSAIARGGASPEVIKEIDAGRFEGIGSFAITSGAVLPGEPKPKAIKRKNKASIKFLLSISHGRLEVAFLPSWFDAYLERMG